MPLCISMFLLLIAPASAETGDTGVLDTAGPPTSATPADTGGLPPDTGTPAPSGGTTSGTPPDTGPDASTASASASSLAGEKGGLRCDSRGGGAHGAILLAGLVARRRRRSG